MLSHFFHGISLHIVAESGNGCSNMCLTAENNARSYVDLGTVFFSNTSAPRVC